MLELLVCMAVYVGMAVAHKDVPEPKRLAALLGVFAVLGLLSVGGPKWGRVAYLLGALILATEVLAPFAAKAVKASKGNVATSAATGLKAASILAGG